MKISVYSKAAIERIIAEEKFPKDTKDGISVFADYNYYPNQVVFHKVYDALVKINSAYCNTYHSSEATGVETLLLKQSFEKSECFFAH